MKIFSVSDLHLSGKVDKPMDIFGGAWVGYWDDIKEDWRNKVGEDDLVLVAGDISWAMRLEDAAFDLEDIGRLPGKKVLIRGNHDYWWSSYSKVKSILPEGMYAIQNNALKFGDAVICGTRGWSLTDEENKNILERELLRLKMSLDEAERIREAGDKLIVMLHYPPFGADFADSGFTAVIAGYGADAVIYGHLHGKDCRARLVVDKGGVPYYLASCDLVQNKLIRII